MANPPSLGAVPGHPSGDVSSGPGTPNRSVNGKAEDNKHSDSDWDAMKKYNSKLYSERKKYRDQADLLHNSFCQFINETKEITDRRFSQLISEISDLGESSAQCKYICTLVVDLVREKAGGLKREVSSRADDLTSWDAEERTKARWQDNGGDRKQREVDQGYEVAESEVGNHNHDHSDEGEASEGRYEASDQYEASDEHETMDHGNSGDEDDSHEHEHERKGNTGALGRPCDPAYPFLVENYLELVRCDLGQLRFLLKGPTETRPGRILLRRYYKKKDSFICWELGEPAKEQDRPTIHDIVIDESAENVRLLFAAYFIIRARKEDLKEFWISRGRDGFIMPERHEKIEHFYERLEKIKQHHRQQPHVVPSRLLSVDLRQGPDGLLRKAKVAYIQPRRLLLARGYDLKPSTACRKVYINAANGKQVQRRSTDVVLSECDDTSIKLMVLVEQILRGRNATEFFPELQPAKKRRRPADENSRVAKKVFKG